MLFAAVLYRIRRFRIDNLTPLRGSSYLFSPLSRTALKPIKPVLWPRSAGWPAQFNSQRL